MAKKKTLKNDDIDEKKRLELYNSQYLIRVAEQRAYDLFLENLVKGTSHLSLGQEAIAAGFATAMQENDKSFCTYRGHAHTLARGASVVGVLGELMQRDCGLMRGKGGSMHLTDTSKGVMGSMQSSERIYPWLLAPLGELNTWGMMMLQQYFGDGTTNIGAFHEL
ncbi:MAG: hypothetical protein CM15mP111_1170 [Hyphomicrobiales bacterium]|nr:MAG: hypothetical protein CM15mP111_1170 [Hyphomicrobiales bacterium]